ncbi:unnamed protein product [Nezara viridula]|uniref:Uncharacterized protein n=1 Tax=Nezara viridula TaxID=85310 RepID=A0A9P0EDZ2_NEZVI|nr:unnamed protein product [Nezara viridula]
MEDIFSIWLQPDLKAVDTFNCNNGTQCSSLTGVFNCSKGTLLQVLAGLHRLQQGRWHHSGQRQGQPQAQRILQLHSFKRTRRLNAATAYLYQYTPFQLSPSKRALVAKLVALDFDDKRNILSVSFQSPLLRKLNLNEAVTASVVQEHFLVYYSATGIM